MLLAMTLAFLIFSAVHFQRSRCLGMTAGKHPVAAECKASVGS